MKEDGSVLAIHMSMRDYFAIHAPAEATAQSGTGPGFYDRMARDAYLYADAMLKAREEKKEGAK